MAITPSDDGCGIRKSVIPIKDYPNVAHRHGRDGLQLFGASVSLLARFRET
jgi:hypothetical protein